MLQIKQVRSYTIARYPRGKYRIPLESVLSGILKDSAIMVSMALLIESCEGTTTAGVPNNRLSNVTETDARIIINRLFADNGISTKAEQLVRFRVPGGDSVGVVLDGYNDSLRVGYEYIYNSEDYDEFGYNTRNAIDSAAHAQGPYVKIMGAVTTDIDYEHVIDSVMQQFVDTLRAHGVI
jgi:hypothetical protein